MAGAYNRLADRTCALMKENVLCLPKKIIISSMHLSNLFSMAS